MSDPEELADEARMERRKQRGPAYEWEYVSGNMYQVPVYEDDLTDDEEENYDDEIPTGN